MATNPYNAQRIFDQQSREAYQRSHHRCICEDTVIVIVKTKRRGAKRIRLGAATPVHLSVCQHSELARTSWRGAELERLFKRSRDRMKKKLAHGYLEAIFSKRSKKP